MNVSVLVCFVFVFYVRVCVFTRALDSHAHVGNPAYSLTLLSHQIGTIFVLAQSKLRLRTSSDRKDPW